MKILVGTKNPNKVREIQAILGGHFTLRPLPEEVPDVEEDGVTFEENARKKVQFFSQWAEQDEAVIAEDSGLEVFALGGEPGIYSARYAGPEGDAVANNVKLLAALEQCKEKDRTARFVCTLIYLRDGREKVVVGEVRGNIADIPRGESGFGYDPVFIPEGHDQSFAEIPHERKNAMSHRYDALAKLKAYLDAAG